MRNMTLCFEKPPSLLYCFIERNADIQTKQSLSHAAHDGSLCTKEPRKRVKGHCPLRVQGGARKRTPTKANQRFASPPCQRSHGRKPARQSRSHATHDNSLYTRKPFYRKVRKNRKQAPPCAKGESERGDCKNHPPATHLNPVPVKTKPRARKISGARHAAYIAFHFQKKSYSSESEESAK